MSTPPPIHCVWDGEAFAPAPRFAKLCDQHFVIGQSYPLEVHEERSSRSHRHYFAALHEAWANLPEGVAERYPTAEHLRKAALIRTGYRDERTIVCSTKAEALRIAAFVRPMDDTAIVTASEAVVSVFTAKSQSVKAMGRADFQKSKDDVLSYVASLVGVSSSRLQQHARAA